MTQMDQVVRLMCSDRGPLQKIKNTKKYFFFYDTNLNSYTDFYNELFSDETTFQLDSHKKWGWVEKYNTTPGMMSHDRNYYLSGESFHFEQFTLLQLLLFFFVTFWHQLAKPKIKLFIQNYAIIIGISIDVYSIKAQTLKRFNFLE